MLVVDLTIVAHQLVLRASILEVSVNLSTVWIPERLWLWLCVRDGLEDSSFTGSSES